MNDEDLTRPAGSGDEQPTTPVEPTQPVDSAQSPELGHSTEPVPPPAADQPTGQLPFNASGSAPRDEPAASSEGASAPGYTSHTLPDPHLARRPGPRTGPIVWGVLILAFCAYILQRTIAPGTVNGAVWITGTLFGLGALLLGVGIAIVVRNARNNRDGLDGLDAHGGRAARG